jgi:hypothetical protein
VNATYSVTDISWRADGNAPFVDRFHPPPPAKRIGAIAVLLYAVMAVVHPVAHRGGRATE